MYKNAAELVITSAITNGTKGLLIRLTDLNAPTHRPQEPFKVLITVAPSKRAP